MTDAELRKMIDDYIEDEEPFRGEVAEELEKAHVEFEKVKANTPRPNPDDEAATAEWEAIPEVKRYLGLLRAFNYFGELVDWDREKLSTLKLKHINPEVFTTENDD